MSVKRRALAGTVLSLMAACSASGYRIDSLAAEINATRDTSPVVISVGDTIRVTFTKLAEFSHDAVVRQDGHAQFRGLDDVQVAGLTLADLDRRLAELYAKSKIDNATDLTVDLGSSGATGDVVAQGLFVIGEVEDPGPIAVGGRPLTLFEAIAAAGGHRKASANLRNVILVRRLATGGHRSWRLDCDIYNWGEQPPIYLQARDIVFVPNTAIDEVNIWVDKYIRQMIPLPTLFPPQ